MSRRSSPRWAVVDRHIDRLESSLSPSGFLLLVAVCDAFERSVLRGGSSGFDLTVSWRDERSLSPAECSAALDELVAAGYVRRSLSGSVSLVLDAVFPPEVARSAPVSRRRRRLLH